jgi:hypothetical protein
MLGEDMLRSMIDQQGNIHYGRLFGLFLIILLTTYGIVSINIYSSPLIIQGLMLMLMILFMIQVIWVMKKLINETLKYVQSVTPFSKITPIHLYLKSNIVVTIKIMNPFIPKTITQLGVMRI